MVASIPSLRSHPPQRAEARAPAAGAGWRRLGRRLAIEFLCERQNGASQLAIAVEDEWPAFVERLQGEPIIAGKHTTHRQVHNLLDVVGSDGGALVEAAHEKRDLFARVAPAERAG